MKSAMMTIPLTMAAMAFAKPEITNVALNTHPVTRSVTVTYSLSEPAIVTAEFTNDGVAIGAEKHAVMAGDVNKMVKTATGTFRWRPRAEDGGFEMAAGKLGVKLTAWELKSPPDYMVIRMDAGTNREYYVSEKALPGGIGDKRYRGECMLMRHIKAAGKTFRMGSPYNEAGRECNTSHGKETMHSVSFTNDWYMGVFEVTQLQMLNTYALHTSEFQNADDSMLRPVEKIGYESHLRGWRGNGYIWPRNGHNTEGSYWFTKMRERTGLLLDLPTEAQWEYSARAGSETSLPKNLSMTDIGTGPCANTDRFGWTRSNANGETHPVGLLEENGWGLYDVIGNVNEMCLDSYDSSNPFDLVTAEDVDPAGWDTSERKSHIVRGGSYQFNLQNDRLACRGTRGYNVTSSEGGFRLWCAMPEE